MLLCYDQHRVIDNRSMWDVFAADTLRGMKRRHEQRIKQLTAIAAEGKTTVLRVIGAIRGASVSASPQTVAKTLLASGRFPDYALLGVDELAAPVLRKVPASGMGKGGGHGFGGGGAAARRAGPPPPPSLTSEASWFLRPAWMAHSVELARFEVFDL